MNCPYCGDSSHVQVVGAPTVALLVAYGPVLGLGVIGAVAAAALVATYRLTGKKIYKCASSDCDKYFIA